MSDPKQLEKFINSAIAQLVRDGNEKALQKLSVIADAEVSGKGLDLFEGKALDLLMQIAANQAEAKAPVMAPRVEPINLGDITDSLTWRGTIEPGVRIRINLHPEFQPYVLPRYWHVDAPSTVTVESVRQWGNPVISGTISAAVFGGGHLPVNWPVVRSFGGYEIEIEFENHGPDPVEVYTELLCEACSEPQPGYERPQHWMPGLGPRPGGQRFGGGR